MRTAMYIIAFILLSIGVAFTIRFADLDDRMLSKKEKEKDKKEGKNDKEKPSKSTRVKVAQKHELPDVLKEISGLVYLDESRFACVEDEDGKIFIYNISSNKIESEIDFGPAGDYEGLAIAGQTAYVLRSDGQIHEVKNFRSGKPSTQIYNTPLTAKHNTEGLCYDAQQNRLLIAIKANEPGNKDYKGIYSFDLKSKRMAEEPVFRIDLNAPELVDFANKAKKPGSHFQPSEIAVHPKTQDIYITDGPKPKLMIMDKTGKIKTVEVLDKKEFAQPEGITFSPEGRLYISNEGNKEPANILELNDLEI